MLEAPKSPSGNVVALDGVLTDDPVTAPVELLQDYWYIHVSPRHGWSVLWYSGLIAAIVIGALLVSALLLVALVSWRRHQLLLETLLPKQVIKELHAEGFDTKGMRIYAAATPADLLLALLGRLLEGAPPDPRDVVLLRTALLRNVDVYAPLNLRGDIKDANLDADVMLALMRQLGAAGGMDLPSLSKISNISSGWGGGGAAESTRPSRRPTTSGMASPPSASAGSMLAHPISLDTMAGALAVILLPDEAVQPSDADSPFTAQLGQSALGPGPSTGPRASPSLGGAANPGPMSFAELRELLRTQGGGGGGSGFTPFLNTGAIALSVACDSSREPSGRLQELPLSAAAAAVVHVEQGAREGTSLASRSTGNLAQLAAEYPVKKERRKSLLSSTIERLAGGSGSRGSPPRSAYAATAFAKQQSTFALTQPPAVMVHPPPAMLDEVERLLAGAEGSWQYDTWRLDEASGGHALSALGFYLIQRQGLLAHFKIQPLKLARLLRAVESGYGSNPYHNSVHAADVLQTLHMLLHGAQMTAHYVDRLGLLAAYLAAIIHDHGHPGLTNDFLIATSDPLAIRYNDRSPLESHHAASAFALLQRPDLDALAGLAKAERAALRKQVLEMVLATDMKQHFAILGQFNTMHRVTSYTAGTNPLLARIPSSREAISANFGVSGNSSLLLPTTGAATVAAPPHPRDDDNGAERLLSLQVALKVADIGHLGEELGVHQRWLAALEEEFFAQGDRERQLGLPISPLFDRAKQGVSKSQVGFYDFAALPLAHAMAAAFPGAQPLLRCFTTNYNHWRRVEGKPTV